VSSLSKTTVEDEGVDVIQQLLDFSTGTGDASSQKQQDTAEQQVRLHNLQGITTGHPLLNG